MNDIKYEREYKSTLTRIGWAMLMFVLLFNLLIPGGALISEILNSRFDAKTVYIADSIIQSAAYMLSFSIPAMFFYGISKKHSPRAVWTNVRLDKKFPLMMVGTIAICLAMAYVNYFIMEIFDYSTFYDLYMQDDPLDENYKLILAIISTALVPALCEEYLFRGVFLTNLMPYGKVTAVVVSSLLFGLMHQNGGQIIYTTVAGIALGLVYVRTRSLWGGMLIHFFNNLFSVFEQLISDRLVYEQANMICTVMEAVIFIVGIVCVIVLICTERKNKRTFDESGFGTIVEPDENYVERPLKKAGIGKMFTSPTILIFLIISVAQMILYVLLALGVMSL